MKSDSTKFLVIEGCNFVDYPVGGQLTFARQLLQVFGDQAAYVGVTTDDTIPVGRWIRIDIEGKSVEFFAYRRIKDTKKPFFPARILDFISIKRFRKDITAKNRFALTQAPEILMAVKDWGWSSFCYLFPGVENPLLMPRFQWGVYFAAFYERTLFRALEKVPCILASAGHSAIQDLASRSSGVLCAEKVVHFPTRVDTGLYFPICVPRAELGVPESARVIVSCGRINRVKGWNLILQSFNRLQLKVPDLHLVFVGDGEDRESLKRMVVELDIQAHVSVTGFQEQHNVARWLNVADLVVVGSHKEGWSISMLESLACGKPIVSTSVSGAEEMIKPGVNGYIVHSRDPEDFAEAMGKGLSLHSRNSTSLEIADRYSIKTLRRDLENVWRY